MAEATSFTGTVTSLRSSYQYLMDLDAYSKDIQFACYNKTPLLQAFGVEAFGVDAMKNLDAFNAARPTGRIIRFDKGKYAVAGPIFATAGTTFIAGRLSSFNPELVEGGDEWKYSWHLLVSSQYLPKLDVDDNSDGAISKKVHRRMQMKQDLARDFNYMILGHSSSPGYSSSGPIAVKSDLTNLISVTQTATIGAIPSTNSFWKNQFKAITSIGGGGEMDRPLTLRRSLVDLANDAAKLAEQKPDYLLVATQGAYQYYDRLMYADSIQGRSDGTYIANAKYDAAGIRHFNFHGWPMVWDPSVTVPVGATASTEAIYGIHIPAFFISIRKEDNFKVTDWEPPRAHDLMKTYQCEGTVRFTPGVSNRRPHFVAYNMPACPD